MQPPSHDQPTARPLFCIGLVMLGMWVLLFCLLTGCGSRPPVVPAVNVQPAQERVTRAAELGTDARTVVGGAVADIRASDTTSALQKLARADRLLAQQQEALAGAREALHVAEKAAALSAERLAAMSAESDRWEAKYRNATKYRFIFYTVAGVGAVITLLKFKSILI